VSELKELTMTHRERFSATLARQDVDRPATWLGMPTAEALPALFARFGVSDLEGLKRRLDDDVWTVDVPYSHPPAHHIACAFDFAKDTGDYEHRTLTSPGYFENLTDPAAVEAFPWPDPREHMSPAACAAAVAAAPRDYVRLGVMWSAHFQDACAAFGMENALMTMLTAPEMFRAVIDRITRFYLEANAIFYDAAGDTLDAVLIGNDLGSQTGLMLSPDLIRQFVLPGTRQLVAQAKERGYKVIHHSCGAVREIIPDLIAAGVDAIHPIQALAAGMGPESLRRDFGDRVAFCGGVDAQNLLVNGTPEQVREKVRELRRVFPTGLIISPSHEAILPDIPPANIEALFAEASAAALPAPTAGAATAPRVWIDPRLHNLPRRPWRKIHQDFHNSVHVPRIGGAFQADEWGDRLLAGNVDAIVVFAKDMHGLFYYPSAYGPVHPGLALDLLGEQVKACRARRIAVYAYYCVTWDHHLAAQHPEWRVIKRDGSDYMPKAGETPGWTALCLAHREYLELMDDHAREFVSRYELDGAWFDMAEPIAPECHCTECRRQLAADGKDPNDAEAQRAHKNRLFLDWHRRMRDVVRAARPGCQVDFNDIGLACVSQRAGMLDNIDIEALPTGGWGYFYAPAQIRYQRTFGIPVYGMTGRFATAWADFGGLKLPQQLDVELASIVANAARCDVGDQMPPNGRLDPAVYHVIGKSYGKIKALEPILEGAAPVAEAAMLIPAVPFDLLRNDYLYGVTKLMLESRLQFDVVEPSQEWERYGLVVLPDALRPDAATVARLHAYVGKGGAVLVIHDAGLVAGSDASWLERYGLTYAGASPFKPAYLVPKVPFTGDIPTYEYALYDGAAQWRAAAPAVPLAALGEPLFQRSGKQFTSHGQTPFDHATDYAAVASSGRVGLLAFPAGASYYRTGYWVYRAAFEKLLSEILPARLIETDAPLSTEITVTRQLADTAAKRPERYLVHVVNWSANRKAPPHSEVFESPVPLHDVRVRLSLPLCASAARAVVADVDLPVRAAGGGIEFVIPRVPIHEVVALEVR
jgi:uroporphyrinogen decarboxylase